MNNIRTSKNHTCGAPLRRAAELLLVFLLILLSLCGCGKTQVISFDSGEDVAFDEPARKADGSAYRIAVMDEGPPIESSYLWLMGLCEEFQALGYISADLDLTKAPEDYEGYYDYILSHDIGDNLVFDDQCYFITDDNQEWLAETLTERVAEGKIDLIAVTGTMPGCFLKELNLPVPFLVSFASDPVGSGIIDSTESTGNENIWALVEPEPYEKQFDVYRSLTGFEKIGLLTTVANDEIGGGPQFVQIAGNKGISVKRIALDDEALAGPQSEALMRAAMKQFEESHVGAVLVLYGVLEDVPYTAEVLADELEAAQIPLLIADGSDLVRDGGMLLINFYNYREYGNHVADVCNRIFHGEKAGDQEIVYNSSPEIIINLTTAKRLGFETGFELLQSADRIYR